MILRNARTHIIKILDLIKINRCTLSLINKYIKRCVDMMLITFTPVNPAILILALSTTTLSSLASDSSRYRFQNAQSQCIISTIQRYREVSPTA